MSWLEAVILGVVQGLTEFLPVSSSAHLVIFGTFFGLSGEENLTFAIIVHAATVLSTICVLWGEVYALLKGLFAFKWNPETEMIVKIGASMIPVAIVGLFFRDYVEAIFNSGLLTVGIMLLVTACLLFFTHYAKEQNRETISYRDAFLIGVAQAVAVIPGLSRSGSTISTGLMLGNKKAMVAKFSFLMVIVPILGETFLDILKGGFSVESCGISAGVLLCGFISAFITGTFACRWMIEMVKKKKLTYFAYYCVAVGLFCIIYTYLH